MQFFDKLPKVKSLITTYILGVALSLSGANAANITSMQIEPTTMDGCTLTIDGIIKKGDAEKISIVLLKNKATFEKQSKPLDFRGKDQIACLSGSGGDFTEALKIADLFILHHIVTSVPSDKSCLSACAIAFLGGRDCCVEFGFPMAKRHLSPNSRLGLSAPTLLIDAQNFTEQDVERAFNEALDVLTDLQIRATKLMVSDVLINTILLHNGGDHYLIEPDSNFRHNYVDEAGKVYQEIWQPDFNERVIE